MPKIILEFNLPDDKYSADNAVRADCLRAALDNIRNEVRNIWKYEENTKGTQKVVDRIYRLICDEIADLSLSGE